MYLTAVRIARIYSYAVYFPTGVFLFLKINFVSEEKWKIFDAWNVATKWEENRQKFLSWSFIANFFHAKESFEQIDNGGMLM